MTPREALDRIAALEVHDPDDRGSDTYDADEVRAILAQVNTAAGSVPPGRCGALSPDGPISCEILAGHAGMHEGRHYPAGVLSTGTPVYWNESAGVTLTPEEADTARAAAENTLSEFEGALPESTLAPFRALAARLEAAT